MKVFISYSRSDESLAHLLAYILTNSGIGCLIDRYLPTAHSFDECLKSMIEEADIVLVLLTQASLSSAWVNQEIGFATARGKLIWPLAMERDIEPDGMISSTEAYSLFDWSDPPRTIESLVMALQGELKGSTNRRFQQIGLDHVLNGKVARTEFLVDRLRDLCKQTRGGPVTIYHQAAFSIFAASDDPMYRGAGHHSDEYMKLLLDERDALRTLVGAAHTEFRLILWPERAYDPKYLRVRFENLLAWLGEIESDDTIQVRCAPYPEPNNRLIIMGDFVLEGYKLNQKTGYEMSVVRYQPTKVENAVAEFEYVWSRIESGKADAIQHIGQLYEQLDAKHG